VLVAPEIESQDKWQVLSDYPGQPEELQCLSRVDKIQFSLRIGKIRAKA
jgi:hypothetical protein